jgi:hypothetical protein
LPRGSIPSRGSPLADVFEDQTRYPPDPERRPVPLDREFRRAGQDWPMHAETMIGLRRLDNIEQAVATVLQERVIDPARPLA